MLIHDASDIPLDLLKIGMALNWDILTVCVEISCWYLLLKVRITTVLISCVFDLFLTK